MYTLEQLEQKTFKELKAIGYELGVLPAGDRRCCQNWINALVGVQPLLLQLLEDSPGVEPVEDAIEFSEEELDRLQEMRDYYRDNDDLELPEGLYLTADQVAEELLIAFPPSIEVQAQEPIETPPGVESKFGRIVYPKPTVKPIPTQALVSFEIGDLVKSIHERWGIEEDSLVGKVTHISPSGRVCVDFGPGGVFDYSRPGKDLIKASIQEVQVQELIAQNAETRPQLDRTESADVHSRRSHPAESVRDSSSAKAEALGSKEGDRVLAVAGNSEAVRGGILPCQPIELTALNHEQPPNRGDGKGRIEPKLSQSAIVPEAKISPGVSRKTSTAHELLALFKAKGHTISDSPVGETEAELLESAIVPEAKISPGVSRKTSTAHELLALFKAKGHTISDSPVAKTEPELSKSAIVQTAETVETLPGITLSDHFLARYAPPCGEPIRFNADEEGQLNLLDFELPVINEPPDPDDFSSIEDFKEAMAHWDIENPEPLTVSMDSMCEWAPVPDEWYEPIDQISPLNPLSMREVMELSRPIECSNTSDFFIPTFDAWCDRPNRRKDSDEPPDTGIFVRLPKPKPPSFPPMIVALGDRANRIKNFARSATHLSGRGPPTPGGDATM